MLGGPTVIALAAVGLALTVTPVHATVQKPAPQADTLPMVATAYGPSAQDNYPYGPVDAFGRPLTPGDVAVDPSVIPLRMCVHVTGYRDAVLPRGGFYGETDDTGGAIRGHRVDLFIDASEAVVNDFGIQDVKVSVLGKPSDPAAAGSKACAAYAHAKTLSGPAKSSPGAAGTATVHGPKNGGADPLKGWVIVVDPGHGRSPTTGEYTGAMGVNGVSEDQNVLDIGRRLVPLLKADGATVDITRGVKDPGPPPVDGLIRRVALAERVHADLYVSIHQNDGGADSRGLATYYYHTDSKTLAEDIQAGVDKRTGLVNDGIKTAPFYVIRKTSMPSVLVEGGFLSNPSEAKAISTAAFHQEEAVGLADSIVTYAKTHQP